jgi:putative ABC transport system substrate-binding protein
MRRRDFITLLGGAAAWPRAVRAQQPAMPVVGFVHYASATTLVHLAESVRRGYPTFPGAESEMEQVEAAGRTIRMQIHGARATTPSDIDTALAAFSQLRVDAFIVGADGYFITRRDQLAALAARYAIPGIYPFPDFPQAGGLLSYGVSLADAYRQAGVLTGRVLKGAKPAELPVMPPTKFEFVLNLRTARALSLDVPPTLVARADEVIE